MIEYQQLSILLDKLLLIYRQLLSVVQSEEQILISSNLDSLKDSNKSKEKVIQKVSDVEVELNKVYARISANLKLGEEKPSLTVLAGKAKEPEWKAKFENYQKVFEMLLKDLSTLNKKNAQMIESAQLHVQGAMDAIKESVATPANYELNGKKDEKNKKTMGSFINREA